MKKFFLLLLILFGSQAFPQTPTQINLQTQVKGTLPCVNGGTGVNTAPGIGQTLVGNGTCFVLGPVGSGTPAPPEASVQIIHNGLFASIPNFIFDSATSPTLLNIPVSTLIKGPVPWYDVQEYNAFPYTFTIAQESTTATTVSGTGNVSLAAALHFQNKEGIVIYQAGNPTTQTTPAAPTATVQGVSGTATFHAACVGRDINGGLTAASPSVTINNAPNIFGNPAVSISSAVVASNILTVTFSSNINAVAGQEIALVGLSGAGSTWNNVWNIATAPAGNQITINPFNVANASATVTGATGRLTNARQIVSISRTGSTITLVTDANSNYVVGTGANNTIITIANVSPADLDGDFVLTSVAGTTLTASSAISVQGTETGAVFGGSSTVFTQEYISVSCPVESGTTNNYIVYGDSPSGGVTMTYLGETIQGQRTFNDWGPYISSGPARRGYVPSSPPAAAQNQFYAGTIVSGAGTPNIVVTPNVPTTVSGQLMLHDQTPGVQAALNAASAVGGGLVYLSPTYSQFSRYVFNSSLNVPLGVDLLVGTTLVVNEDIQIGPQSGASSVGNKIYAFFSGPGGAGLQFSQRSYQQIIGSAKTFFEFNSAGDATMDGLLFQSNQNVQNFVVLHNTAYTDFSNLAFGDNSNGGIGGANIGLTVLGQGSSHNWRSFSSTGYGPSGQGAVAGEVLTYTTPLLPMIWLRACDNTTAPNCLPTTIPAQIYLSGNNTINGRGILLDESYGSANFVGQYSFEHNWDQAATAPFVSFYGNQGFIGLNIEVNYVVMDTSPMSVFGNFTNNGIPGPVTLAYLTTSAWGNTNGFGNALTGNSVSDLIYKGAAAPIGQNFNVSFPATSGGFMSFFGFPYTGAQFGMANAGFAFTYQSKPNIMSSGAPVFWPYPSITGLTVSSIGSGGAVPIGAHTYCVSSVGWNGGWSLCSNSVSATTTPGNQTVNLSWNPVSGAKGYQVFRDGRPVGASLFSFVTTTNTTYGDISSGVGAGNTPNIDGSGPTQIDNVQAVAPAFRAVNGQSSAVLSSDSFGNPLLNGLTPTTFLVAQDLFQRGPSGTLGSNWTYEKGGLQLSAFNAVQGTSASNDNLGSWIGAGSFGGPQYSSITVSALNQNPGSFGAGPSVYITGTAGTTSSYVCDIQDHSGLPSTFVPGTIFLRKYTSGTLANIASATVASPRTSFQLTLSAFPVGTTTNLSCAVDGIVQISFADSSSPLSSGTPGIYIFSNFEDVVSSWSAGGSANPNIALNVVPKGTGTPVLTASSITDDGVNPTRTPNGIDTALNGNYDKWVVDTGGVAANKLACRSSNNKAQICAAGITQGILGVAQSTVTSGGTVEVCWSGHCQVIPTNNTTAGHWLIPSATVPGAVDDTGSTSEPSNTQTFLAESTVTAPAVVNTTILSPDTTGASSGSAGSPTLFPLENCTPDTSGLVFWTVNALTNWRDGHWEWSDTIASTTSLYCKVKIPHTLPSGVADIILFNLNANDATSGHTMTFKTCDIVVSTTVNIGAPTCAATQNFTTTTTAYAPSTLTFAVQSTVVADNELIVVVDATTESGLVANVQLEGAYLEFH